MRDAPAEGRRISRLGPTARRLVIVALGLVALVLLAGTALKMHGRKRLAEARARFEKQVGSLDLLSHAPPGVPDEDNAATWLAAGARALLLFDGDEEFISDLVDRPTSGWSDSDASRLRAILDRNAGGLLILDRARACSASNFKINYRRGESEELPGLLATFKAARLLHAKAKLEIRQSAFEDAARTIETLGSLAASLEREPIAIVLLIGSVTERRQLAALQELAQRGSVKPALLTRLRSSLPSIDLEGQYRRAIAVDAAGALERLFSEGTVERVGRFQDTPWVRGQVQDLAAAADLDFRRDWVSLWELPYPAAREAARARGEAKPFLLDYLADVSMAQSLEGVARIRSVLSARRLAAIGIRLRLQALEGGRYPADLSAYPEASSPDPFTGQSLRYDVRADGSAELGSPGAGEMLAELAPGLGALATGGAYRWLLPAPAGTGGATGPGSVRLDGDPSSTRR